MWELVLFRILALMEQKLKTISFFAKLLNLETSEIEELSLEDCKFGYRDSIFKTSAKGKCVIVEVTFKTDYPNHLIKTEYGAISTELKNLGIENPTIQEVSKAVINIRQKLGTQILPKLETLEVSSKIQAFL